MKKKTVIPTDASIDQLVASTLKNLQSKYGKSVVDYASSREVERGIIPTNIPGLDIALGVGGFPRGGVIEIYGPESTGKTTLILHAIAEAQKQGHLCAYIDLEHSFDKNYAASLGVDISKLIHVEPDSAEDALQLIRSLVPICPVIATDSVAALSPKAEIEGETGDQQIGKQARLMSQFFRQTVGAARAAGSLLLFTNQTRMKVGVMFGNPETTPGGQALRFYAHIRLDLRSGGAIKEGDRVVGKTINVTVKKNKCAGTEGSKISYNILLGKGIDKPQSLLETALLFGVIEKEGNSYSFLGNRLGTGKGQASTYLRENTDTFQECYSALLAAVDTSGAPVSQEVDDSEQDEVESE